MESLFYNISQVLGIAILHSLWQGLLIWFLLRVVFSTVPSLSAVKKYNMAVAAMLGIAAWFMVTLFNEAGNFNWSPVANAPSAGFVPQAGLVNQLSPFKAQADRYYYIIAGYLPYISILYITGLVVNLFKLSYCRVKLFRIKKALLPAGDMQWLVDDFSERLDIRRYVRVNFSSLVDVPCMIGYLKPIILLPISLSANLSVAETEAILLHELAHIKRNDYLVNLLQQVINSLLFFNPFAQMINRLISAERENCCDDLVVQTTNSPLVYARALLKLEESRQTNLQLALAASTKKTYLLTRIERIMKTQQKIGNIRHLVLAILLLAGSLSSIAWLNPEIKNGKVTVNAIKPAEVINKLNSLFADTTRKKATKAKPSKNKYIVQKDNKEKYHTDRDVYYDNGFNDPQLKKLSAEVNRYAEVVGKYYDSEKFKAFSTQMDKYGKEVDAFYNSDRIKRITAEQSKLGADFSAISSNPNAEQYGKQMEVLGKKIEKYFSSPDFKDLNAKLKAKYGVKSDYNDDRDDNYRKYQDELQSKLSPEIKAQTSEMKELGEKMRSFYQSDEFVTKRDKLRAMSDSMREAYNNPAIKQQQAEMRKLGDQMRAYADNPEIKKQKELLRKASDKLRAYTNTPEFRAKVKEYRASAKYFNWNNDNDNNNNNDNDNDRDSDLKKDVPSPVAPPDVKEPVKP
jgi:bla regulator protein BlaR1